MRDISFDCLRIGVLECGDDNAEYCRWRTLVSASTWKYSNNIRANTTDLIGDEALCSCDHGGDGDNGGNTNNNPEHCQKRAHFLTAEIDD